MKPKIYYDMHMNPKCRFCGGEQENVGFRGTGIPHVVANRFRCNSCLIDQTYDRTGELLEFTLEIPTDRSVKFGYGQFHYIIDFDPITMKLMMRSYSEDEGWKLYFEVIIRNQPDWLNPSISVEKIKTLILFS